MSCKSSLFGGTKKHSNRPLQEQQLEPLYMAGDGEYEFLIVGESHHQDALDRIAGPKKDGGVEFNCIATLICENDNPNDNNSVAVYIDGSKIGYLSKPVATSWRYKLSNSAVGLRPITVDARIVGGWNLGTGGNYAVKLDICC